MARATDPLKRKTALGNMGFAPIDRVPPDGTWISDEVLTPWGAYLWLRHLGIPHEQARTLTSRRSMFDFYLECIRG